MNNYDDLYDLLHFLDQKDRQEFYNKLKTAVHKKMHLRFKNDDELESLLNDLEEFSKDIGCEN